MTDKPLKVDLHTHSSDDPHDEIPYSSEDLIDEFARQGFDVLALTNHNRQSHSDYLADYARERGILLIKGMELTYERQHIVLLNFGSPDDIHGPEDIIKRKGPDNLVLASHPYFPFSSNCGRLLDSCHGLFDAVEYSHLYIKGINFNVKAARRAKELNLPLAGTSDAHFLCQVGHTYTEVYSDKTPEAVIGAIKEGRSRLVTRPMPVPAFIRVVAGMFYGDIRRAMKGRASRP